uniref:Uncharacterized protein n=1 Tax=Oryzias latipes TaxID=8090 RepID=A0A3B3INX0_ORYLA
MTVLIYAQQSFGSFSAAAKGAAGGLTAQGCRVEVSDLYAIKFQVSAPAEDINGDEGSLANLVISQFQVLVHFILSVTTDSLESMFRDIGIMGDMNITLWPMLSCTCMASRFCSLRSFGFFLLKLIRAYIKMHMSCISLGLLHIQLIHTCSGPSALHWDFEAV